jgi:hypothetical protein
MHAQSIHLTIMRPTTRENIDIRCYIVRLAPAIFLKLQESVFLLHTTRCSNTDRYVKRSARGLPNNLLPNFPEILPAIAAGKKDDPGNKNLNFI